MSCHVLVTGGAGYLGSIICEHALAEGYEVTVVDNLMYQQQSLFHFCANERFHFVHGDVRDESLMAKVVKAADVIVPLAALVGAPACSRNPWETTAINLEAIRSINRFRSSSQLIVYPTTNSGYGCQSGDVFCTEETPLEPISLYGQTKVQAERELLDTSHVITLRLATVFGMSPRMRIDLLVNHFVHAALNDGFIVIFEKDFKRNYIHVRDVADCFLHAIKNADRMAGNAFNAGLDAANLSKEELALKIKEYVPGFYIHFAEVGCDPDKRNYIVSNQKLREAGFEAKRSLDDGIKELIKGYQMLGRGTHKNV
ncbi:MAG: NAD-dependent epimerase/dehydratase family protein [Syntrophobacteraceae bacterium]